MREWAVGAWGSGGCTRHASMSVPSISQPARAHSSGEAALGLQNHVCALLKVASRSCRSASECGRQVVDVPKAASGSIMASRSASERLLAGAAGAASALPPIANGERLAAPLKRLPWLMLKGEIGEAAVREEERIPESGVAPEGGWWLVPASSALSRLSRIVLTSSAPRVRLEAIPPCCSCSSCCEPGGALGGGRQRTGKHFARRNPKTHAALPCGHLRACGECSARLRECPVCRASGVSWFHVHLA